MTQSGPDSPAQSVGRVARLSGNVRQPDHVLANSIAGHKTERRPRAGEEWLAATKYDGVDVKSILKHFPTATRVTAGSNSRSGCLEGKGEERGDAEKRERHDIIPREFFFQKRDSEDHKNDEGHDLLNDLELEA